MAIFVLCMNLLVAAFILTFVAEFVTLLMGSLVYALEYWKRRHGNGT